MTKARLSSLSLRLSIKMFLGLLALFIASQSAYAQWASNGNNINNTNSGNVGVGTTAPNAKLEVHHTSATTTPAGVTYADIPFAVRNTNTTDGNFNIISFLDGNGWGNVHLGAVQVSHSAHTGDFFLSTRHNNNFSEKLRIKSDGKVGFGISSPSAPLQLNSAAAGFSSIGQFLITDSADTNRNLRFGYDSSLESGWIQASKIGTSYKPLLLNPNLGNVGIGLTNPGTTLDVAGNILTVGSEIGLTTRTNNTVKINRFAIPPYTAGNLLFSVIAGATTSTENIVGVGGAAGGLSAATVIVFHTAANTNTDTGTERMRITSAGNVGIGTTSPGFKFDVQGGQINSSGGLCIAGDCKTAWSQVGGGTSQWTTNGTAIHYNTGNVGIGNPSPGSKLFVGSGTPAVATLPGLNVALGGSSYISASNGTENIFMGADASGYGILGTLSNHGLGFRTNNMERVRIDASGNVGIGIATPNAKLQVGGGLFVGTGTPAVATLAGLNVALGGSSYISASNGTENIFMGAGGDGYGVLGTLSNHGLGFRTNNAERVRIDTSGNVGIGTAAPTEKLHVQGNGKVTGNLTVDGNLAAKYQDVAEWVPAAKALPPGTVVTLSPTQANFVEASAQAYDTRVAGVISERPGIALGESGENKVLVATTGRVKVKVDATKAPINIGDLLVTSDTSGMAMKSEPIAIGGRQIHSPGTLIGKALEPLAKGQGEILVLLSLQ